MGEALVKGIANFINGLFFKRISNFINGYMGEALVKGIANFINELFVKRVSKFINGYICLAKIIKKPDNTKVKESKKEGSKI